MAAAALPSLLAACFIVTGSSDGYVAARDAGPAVDAGTGGCLPDVFTIATSCVSAKDCAEGEICCLGAQGTINSAATSASNAFILSCITSTCQTSCNSLELQLCASNAECTDGGVQSGGDADVVDAAPSDTDSAVGAEPAAEQPAARAKRCRASSRGASASQFKRAAAPSPPASARSEVRGSAKRSDTSRAVLGDS